MNKQQIIDDFNYDIECLNKKLLKIKKDIEKTNKKLDLIKCFDEKDLVNVSFRTNELINNSSDFSKSEFFKIQKKKNYDFWKLEIILGYKKVLNNKNYKIYFKPITINEFRYKDLSHLISSCNDTLLIMSKYDDKITLVNADLDTKITESLKDVCIDYYYDCLPRKPHSVSENSLYYEEYLRLKSLNLFK